MNLVLTLELVSSSQIISRLAGLNVGQLALQGAILPSGWYLQKYCQDEVLALRSCSIRSYLLNWCWPSFPITSLLPVWLDVGEVSPPGSGFTIRLIFQKLTTAVAQRSLVGQRQKSKIMLKANWSMIFKREQHNCALYILSPQIYPLVYYPVDISETPNCNVVALVRSTPPRNFTLAKVQMATSASHSIVGQRQRSCMQTSHWQQ